MLLCLFLCHPLTRSCVATGVCGTACGCAQDGVLPAAGLHLPLAQLAVPREHPGARWRQGVRPGAPAICPPPSAPVIAGRNSTIESIQTIHHCSLKSNVVTVWHSDQFQRNSDGLAIWFWSCKTTSPPMISALRQLACGHTKNALQSRSLYTVSQNS